MALVVKRVLIGKKRKKEFRKIGLPDVKDWNKIGVFNPLYECERET
jgi:hypothetical protein